MDLECVTDRMVSGQQEAGARPGAIEGTGDRGGELSDCRYCKPVSVIVSYPLVPLI
jgi:hypothetical protein